MLIARLEIILKLIGIENSDDRNPVLLEDEVFLVHVGATGELPKVDAGLAKIGKHPEEPVLISRLYLTPSV